MGGIAKYQEAFFNPDFIKEHPEWAQDISRLSTLLHEQVNICSVACHSGKKLYRNIDNFVLRDGECYLHSYQSFGVFLQVDIVESGLVIHGQLVSHDMLPLHHRLLERLDELQASLKCPQLDPNLLM